MRREKDFKAAMNASSAWLHCTVAYYVLHSNDTSFRMLRRQVRRNQSCDQWIRLILTTRTKIQGSQLKRRHKYKLFTNQGFNQSFGTQSVSRIVKSSSRFVVRAPSDSREVGNLAEYHDRNLSFSSTAQRSWRTGPNWLSAEEFCTAQSLLEEVTIEVVKESFYTTK